jgi:hypothetical protein
MFNITSRSLYTREGTPVSTEQEHLILKALGHLNLAFGIDLIFKHYFYYLLIDVKISNLIF